MAGPHTRFYLEKQDAQWAGVCSGIADYFGVDVTLVRVGMVIATLLTGWGLIAYLLLAWLAPAKPTESTEPDPEEKKFWQGVRANPRRTAQMVRARFREIDRRLADAEAYLTSPDKRLAREIENLR